MSPTPEPLSHDPLFKNLVTDFPEDTLRWLLPEAESRFGKILKVDFLRQEMTKHWLSDEGRELDIPIQYTFERQTVLITLIEHQSAKETFSIYKLAHYTLDLMERFPQTPVIPIVIFADEKRWKKDVRRELRNELRGDLWLYFRFQKVKLKEIKADEVRESDNPVLTILTPTLDYPSEERLDWAVWAYLKLYRILGLRLFQKYMDFVDKYAKIKPHEKQGILDTLTRKEEGIMIREAILQEGLEKGLEKGRQEAFMIREAILQEGIQQGIQQGLIGKIHLSQKLLKQPLSPEADLRAMSLDELQRFAEQLENRLLT